jgi:hypothetical protein
MAIFFVLKILFLMLFDQLNNCQFLKEDSAPWNMIETHRHAWDVEAWG